MEYTTLKTILGFTDRDLNLLSNSPNGDKISHETVPDFVLGTVINTIASTFVNTPIFNLKDLQDKGLLDLNRQSASKDDLCLKMTSNKDAASSSSKTLVDVKAAANFGGIVGASAGAHYDQSMALSHSDGSVYVSMQRGKHGSYYEINANDLAEGYNLSGYLVGEEVKDTKQYVDYTEKIADGKAYIAELIFGGYEESGMMSWALRNYYGNIQLLTKMEEIFALLLQQYADFKEEKDIQAILYTNMEILKGKIYNVVRDFYSHVGTHFVKKLCFANSAYGYGILEFDESSGNQESCLGVSVSLSGGIPSVFSVSAEGSASYAKKQGWANAMKNLHIEVHDRPDGIVDLQTFEQEIKAMLDAEGKPLSVPSLSMPSSPEVELLDKPEVKKKHLGPPDSVFSSYADWKEYQEDIQKDKQGKNKVHDSIHEADDEVEEEGAEVLLDDDEAGKSGKGAETNLYHAYVKEMKQLKSSNEQQKASDSATNSQILRIDNMFVSSYETEPYESVIPSLRTNKIVLPDKENQIDIYPNSTKIMLVIGLFRQLSEYTRFMSNFTISNILTGFAEKIEQFHEYFSREGYKMVTDHMSVGKDVDTKLMHDFAKHMYGNPEGENESELLIMLGSDIDRFNYVRYLLKPEVMRIWKDAPGGYAPFFFNMESSEDEKLCFAALNELVILAQMEHEQWNFKSHLLFDLQKQIDETPDVAELYENRAESPLYPVFRYDLANTSKLLFLQLAGRFQLIYGKNGIIQPFITERSTALNPLSLTKDTFNSDFIPNTTDTAIKAMIDTIQGIDVDQINNDYALYFPNKTQTKTLREANRVVIPTFDWNEKPTSVMGVLHKYAFNLSGIYYLDINETLIAYKDTFGTVVKVEDGAKMTAKKFPVLLPIDYSKISGGYGSLIMGSSFGASDYIDSPTYNSAVVNSMHDQ